MTRREGCSVKCFTCGTQMKSQRENYRYAECGLKHVTLLGLTVNRCPRCGNHEVSIPRIEALHRLIAGALIEKATRFTGEEIRFLRESLGWSAADLARHMGVAAETVSRWEHDVAPIGPQADRLLRLVVARGRPAINYPTERLASIEPGEAKVERLELELRGDAWDRLSA
jgi:putative zinc finger/helix-turn-helix YgiT family protein